MMKIKLFFILFLASTTICFGQRNKDKHIKALAEFSASKINENRSTDSVYSFLQQVDFENIIPSNQKIAIVEKPMNDEYFHNNPGWMSLVREMTARISPLQNFPVLGEESGAEILYAMTDTVSFDKPIDYWNISEINKNYIGITDFEALINFVNYTVQDSVNRKEAVRRYKREEKQKIFISGQKAAQERLRNSISVVEMSIPYFDKSYNCAILVIEFTKDEPPFFLIFKRDINNKWQFEGSYSQTWGFSTKIQSRAGREKFYEKK